MKTLTRIALAATALIAMTGAAHANASSGSINLGGSVALNCTVGVTDAGVALNLTAGETNRSVGQVVETCNSGTGYTIQISSANAGQLTSSGSGTTPINYQVGYDGQSGALSSAMTLTRNNAQFGLTRSVSVTIPGSAQYIAGAYSDTITVTIQAK